MHISIFGAFKVCTLLAIGIWSSDIFAASVGPTQSELDHAADGNDTWLMTNKRVGRDSCEIPQKMA